MSRTDAQVAALHSLRLRDGRTLCARSWPGTGEQPVVLLHGLLDSSAGWTDLGRHLDQPRIAFDLPGFGDSDAPREGSISGYASDVAEGLAMLGVERFTLVGHSLGGAVAAAVAELIPSSVAALVLLAPAGFGRIQLAEAVSIPGVRNLVQAALPFALSSRIAVTAAYLTMVTNGRTPEREIVDRLCSSGRSLVAGAREGTRAIVEAGKSDRAFHRRRLGYDGPVHAVWGDCDRLVPSSHRRGVQTAFPHARIDVWHGMGHHPLRERFDDLMVVIAGAVSRVQADATRSLAEAA